MHSYNSFCLVSVSDLQISRRDLRKTEAKMSNSRDVQGHLEKVAAGGATGRQKLVFDPASGKLKVANDGKIPADNVVCTGMAAAGFFISAFNMTGTTTWFPHIKCLVLKAY